MSEWKQVGPTWQRLYANGVLGIVRPYHGSGRFTADRYTAEGNFEPFPIHPSKVSFEDIAEAFKHMDAKHDPTPELVERGDDWTLMKNGKRGAMAAFAFAYWWANVPGEYSKKFDKREECEMVVSQFVMGSTPGDSQ